MHSFEFVPYYSVRRPAVFFGWYKNIGLQRCGMNVCDIDIVDIQIKPLVDDCNLSDIPMNSSKTLVAGGIRRKQFVYFQCYSLRVFHQDIVQVIIAPL